jgi:uncharacterized protein (UPF0276 family)
MGPNYGPAGGPPHRWLEALRQSYALSIHGVGLSLGTSGPLDRDHLDALARLVRHYQPRLVSEHLAWSRFDGVYINDLLPIPYTEETLAMFADHVDQTQNRLGRTILIENPSATFAYGQAEMSEAEFLAQLVKRTGCGILLDVNNLYVSARNIGIDETAYLAALPPDAIGEYHLAGHAVRTFDNGAEIRIDDHGSAVKPEVWALFTQAVHRFGPRPTLIEWDNDVPDLDTLLAEAMKADAVSVKTGAQHVLAS